MAVCFCGGSLMWMAAVSLLLSGSRLIRVTKAPNKHKAQTPEQDAVTVDAFHPDTVAQVENVRRSVQSAFELHSQYW